MWNVDRESDDSLKSSSSINNIDYILEQADDIHHNEKHSRYLSKSIKLMASHGMITTEEGKTSFYIKTSDLRS